MKLTLLSVLHKKERAEFSHKFYNRPTYPLLEFGIIALHKNMVECGCKRKQVADLRPKYR